MDMYYVDKTVYGILERIESLYGERRALTYRDGSEIIHVTYTRLWRDIRRLAGEFERRGLQKKYIAISGRNTYEQVVAMLAAATMGAVAAMINFDLAKEDLYLALGSLTPALVVYDEMDREFVGEYLAQAPGDGICCTGESESISHILMSGTEIYEKKEDVLPEAPALMIMTSGSTAHSKLVLLSQRAFFPMTADLYMDGERSILVFPLFHITGPCFLMGSLAKGCDMCLSGMKTGIMDVEWFRPNILISVPAFLYEAVKRMKKGKAGYDQLRAAHSGGAPVNIEIARFLQERNIFSVSEYGCTETTVVTISLPDAHRPGSVGKPGFWNAVRISDNGEILIKGSCVMQEYIGNPEATKAALSAGWYHTGDIGYLDEDGYLFITGRINNVILFSNGENVSPEAIEAKLIRCPAIEEVLVYGENERIKAKIWCGSRLRESAEPAVRGWVEEYNRSVPTYHQIRELVFCGEPLPKTSTGKIDRRNSS